MNILVTGGAGYIGSHTCVELLNEGHKVIVIDNLINACEKSIERIKQITGKEVVFYKNDVRDSKVLDTIFNEFDIDCVIHFAGLKAVGESVSMPLKYYDNNLLTTIKLCESMCAHHVSKIIFSSSATVYNVDNVMPLTETSCTGKCTNPYGWSKYMSEQILRDTARVNPDWSVVLLRYFNPIGAHPSGLIGENPKGIPNNLVPYITQVAIGKFDYLNVYGGDYNTPDGTGIRDFIHVCDLAVGHVKALKYMKSCKGVSVFNLGTGIGYSVLDVVHAFERITGLRIPYRIVSRRFGDVGMIYSNPNKSFEILGWKAQYTLDDMCRDAWNWQNNNPEGFQE